MKDNILQSLMSVVDALNNVSVRGEANMSNVLGSINALRQVMQAIHECELTCPAAHGGAEDEAKEKEGA